MKFVEIFPSGEGECIKEKLNLNRPHFNPELHATIQRNYVELFNESTDIEKIASDLLLDLIKLTRSKDGFIGIIKGTVMKYYSLYMDVTGIALKGQNKNCEVSLHKNTLISYPIKKSLAVISNAVCKDPRASHSSPNNSAHPKITTFLALPLVYNDTVIGELGLSNAEKYSKKTMEKLLPAQGFYSNFIHLYNTKQIHVLKEISMKKEMSTLKDTFIATMSHEIRTPLNGIATMTQLLLDTDTHDSQDRYLNLLSSCCTQLMSLVNDILDYSKMSSSGLVLNNASFNLHDCIKEIQEISENKASAKNIEMIYHIDVPEVMSGDSRRLKQVLLNLLTNAIKFTEEGSVTLTAECKDIDRNRKNVIFTIKDTGIGIKKSNQSRIFELFTKINEGDSFSVGSPGVGLGLAISKFIVDAMGGSIRVESDGANGSTFTFNVVLCDESPLRLLLQKNSDVLKDKTAIVVDDCEENRIYLMNILTGWGMNVVVFSSGRETLSYLNIKKDFDLALIDLSMPIMSGIELTQKIRERGFSQPLIGLSSIGNDIRGRDWFTYFKTKPVSKIELFDIILQSLQLDHKRTSSSSNSDEGEFKILIAEDDAYNQLALTELLKNLGYTNITVVNNGHECVEEVKRHTYHVCLMDIKMPVMDGLEATRRIKNLAKYPTIIAVSASVLDSDKDRCFKSGMDGYIPKPIDKQQLKSVLEKIHENYARD